MMPRGASPALAIYATRWPVVGRARRVCRLGQDRVGQDTFAVFHEESASPQRESRLRRGIRMAASVRRSGVIMFCPILLNVFAFMRPCFVGTETTMPKHQTSLEKIERKKDDAVFLVCEFTKLGGEDQALRALRTPLGKGRLVRLGNAPWPCQSLEADAGWLHRRGASSARRACRGRGTYRSRKCPMMRAFSTQIPVKPGRPSRPPLA
ncbi:hypothetical protein ACVWZV_000333 [Bradyrhizobium sp. GM5.1]